MKKFLYKSALFIVLILTIQAFIPLPQDLRYKIKKIEAILQYSPDVIYFGDSTLKWSAPDDRFKIGMPDILKALIPGAEVVKLTFPSYQPDVYFRNFQYLLQRGFVPRFAIFPVNLRCFSPEWERQPLWQFEEDETLTAFSQTGLIRYYKPLTVFKLNRLKISNYDYLHTKVYAGRKLVGEVKDFDNPGYAQFSEEKMRAKLMFRYMPPLEKDHRFLKSLTAIARMARQYGVEPIFYVTPIDCQTGKKYLGKDFERQVAANVAVVRESLAEEGASLLDFSRSLGTQYFSWPVDNDPPAIYPNEHLRFPGRKYVVETVYNVTKLKEL